MTDQSKATDPVSNASEDHSPTPAPVVRETRSGALPILAVLLAATAIALPFYSHIRDTVERHAGPLPWLPRELVPTQSSPLLQATGTAVSTGNERVALAQVQADIAELKTSVAQIVEVKAEAAASLKAAQEAGAGMTALSNRVDAAEAAAAQKNKELSTSVADLSAALSKLATPSEAPLVAARLVLLSVNGELAPQDIEQLTGLVSADPALAEIAGQLRALAGESIPTITALQVQFNAIKDSALQKALTSRLGWMESGLSLAHETLSEFGLLRPGAEEKDQVVILEAARQIDSGKLGKALFELQAASPELRQLLAPWISAAELRVTLDKTLQQLIDGLLSIKVMPPDAPGAG